MIKAPTLTLPAANGWLTHQPLATPEAWGFTLIAGPCSAESREQVWTVGRALAAAGVQTLRFGIWKPRSRPNAFEGAGAAALAWVGELMRATGLRAVAEVATPEQVEAALKAKLTAVWLGARTTVNPFTVSELAEALRGTGLPVMVKNPITPDLALWLGAIERLHAVGVHELAACHRGFAVHGQARYRNLPMWELPLELRRLVPDLPLIGDPSHIAGARAVVPEVAQRMLDLGYDGLMIESHPDPDRALSDAAQQLTPVALMEIISQLLVRQPDSPDAAYHQDLEALRAQIDDADHDLLRILARRLSLAERIGELKNAHDVQHFQTDRWGEVFRSRLAEAERLGLSAEFVAQALRLLHAESLNRHSPGGAE